MNGSDLSALSNEQLMGLLGGQPSATAPTTQQSGSLASLSNADLMAQLNATSPPAPSLSAGETVADVLRSAKSGLGRGVIGLAGLPAALGSLAAQGSDYAFGTNIAPGAQRFADVAGPEALQRKVEGYTGKFYEPKSWLGQGAQTIAEFLPAAAGGPEGLLARVATRAVLPAVASEAAGQLTAGTAAEPYARAAGAIGGALSPAAARRLATPFAVAPERAGALRTLQSEGIQVPASMATGSKALKSAESELGGTQYGDAVARMNAQFTQATLKRAGIDAQAATPDVLNAAEARIGSAFDTVAARNPTIPVAGFGAQAKTIADDFRNITGTEPRLLEQLAGRVGTAVSGEGYQAIQSEIQRYARAATANPALATALYDLKGALDKSVQAGLKNPADAAAWAEARRQWKNLLIVTKAVSGSTEAAASGLITPAKLTQAIESMKRGSYAKGQGDFSALARAGNQIMKPLQDSGTASRLAAKGIPALIGGILGGGIHPLGVAGAVLAPAVAGRVLMSPPVQSYLRNQRFVAPARSVRRNVGAVAVPAIGQGTRP